ncbi:bola-like protein [Ophiobolus disseminans]|uniref:Bola-like protein n=1 Tax=Ophiobolus disseminans TaxID=1469910 RepID=A0A6A6ZJY6_9PLEO|nr:bola-like protein [Ophiobolus disseminans]
MAPSRALIRRIAFTSTQPHMRPSPRLFSAFLCKPQKVPHRSHLQIRNTEFPASKCVRQYSSQASAAPEAPDYLNEAELHIFNKIKGELEPVKLEVQDISGGCGSMYAIEIESPRFQGLTVIKQHKLVNQVLKEEIAQWHGVQLRTKAA